MPSYRLLLLLLGVAVSFRIAAADPPQTVTDPADAEVVSETEVKVVELAASEAKVPVVKDDGKSWTSFRGDPLATGQAKSVLPDDPTLLWKYEVKNGAFESTPIVVEGVCYVPDLDGTLHAIGLDDGKAKWTKKTGAFSFAASPAYRNGRMYVGDIDGIFYCFDLKGKEVWRFEPKDGGIEINSSATFYGDKLLYGSQDAVLYCLNTDSGKLEWKLPVEDQIRCSPTVVSDRSFVAGCDGQLHIVDIKKGEEAASVPIDAPTGTTPAVMGGHVYFGTEYGEFFKIDWKTAKIEWRFREKRPREIRSSAAVNAKVVVFGSRSKNVYGVNPADGNEMWKYTCKRGVDSSPVITGDNVVVASSDGRIYLLNWLTGKEVWKKETGDSFASSPAVVDGRLLIASNDGVVYCFGKK